MKVLYVEDDAEARELIARFLGEAGLQVETARDGRTGLERALGRAYDALVLDVKLPGVDGFEMIRRIRAAGVTTPVLCLTALGEVASRVRGLELGADDYLVKPYAFSELLARVRALLRRGKEREGDVLRMGDLEVHLLRRRVERAGHRIDLTAKEYALLLLFLRRRGEVLSRTLIAEQVWDMNFDSDTNVVEVAVRRLRAKIDDPFALKLVHTVRGFGYVMEERAP
jgi:two-component system copper resistance phosphate regulon response regulator CusR